MKSRILAFLIILICVAIFLFSIFSMISNKKNQDDSRNQNSSIICSFGDDSLILKDNSTGSTQEIYLRLQNVTDDSEQDLESYYYPDGPVLGHGYDKNGMVVLIYEDWVVNKTVIQDIYSIIERHGEQNGIKRIFTRFLPIGLMKPDSYQNHLEPILPT